MERYCYAIDEYVCYSDISAGTMHDTERVPQGMILGSRSYT